MASNSHSDLKGLIPLLRPHVRRIWWGCLCMLIYVICWPVLAFLAGELIPAIGSGNITIVIEVIAKALGVFLIQKFAQFGQDTLLAGPALYVSQELRKDLFKKLQKVKLSALEKLSSGDITYRLTEDADRIGEIIYKTIQDTTPSILQLIAVFGYMIWLDWKLSSATLLLAPFLALLVGQFGAKVMQAAEKSQKKVSDIAGLLTEALQGLSLVRAFSAEEWLFKRFESEVNLHREARYRNLRLLALQHPVVGFIEAAGILTILAFGAIRIKSGNLDSQGFSSYIAALIMLIDPISHLTTNFNEFKQAQASFKRLKAIEREPQEAKDSDIAQSIKNPKGSIQFKNVCFSYETSKYVLIDFSINICSGKTIALVGPSGAGKSTIFSLLLRFYIPNSGTIFLDGLPLDCIRIKELRNQIAIVPQNSYVFSGSIQDNIKFGRDASIEQVIAAAKIANANDFINDLPNGYGTMLEERGTNISGGQLQRIAIARAILGNPSVLLLDEATSALDAEAETAIQIGLKQAMKGRTVIVIAHRLATVQEADEIIVLDKGHISEKGTHLELMKREGRYRELCEKQVIKDLTI